MKKLIKTICGEACEVYAIIHHDRVPIGKAIPEVEVYESSVEGPTLGTGSIRCKNSFFLLLSAQILRWMPK